MTDKPNVTVIYQDATPPVRVTCAEWLLAIVGIVICLGLFLGGHL